jgi:alkylation response protein AidB-like acyl-CoA dehydrogenase
LVVDIDDTPEEAAFRAEARAWLDANAIPKGHPDDFSAGLWSGDYDQATYVARCRAWQRRLHEGGWAGITWPKEYGGRGGRPIEQVIFNQEQGGYGVSNGAYLITLGMVGPTILAHGSATQKDRFIPAMLRGDELWCQLFSEPDAGSDLAGLTTRASLDGDQWVVTGQKVWTSSAERAAWGILLARTDWDVPKHRGITYFLLDMTTPGITIRPLRQMTGESHFSEVFLDGVRIPTDRVLGAPGEGWRVAQTTLTSERSSIAGTGLGASDPARLVELAQQAGRATDPLVRQAVAEAHIQHRLLRFLGYRLQTALSQGRRPGQEASVMKLGYARYMKHLNETAIGLQGPAGQLGGADAVHNGGWYGRFLHAPSLRIAGGSDQVQATIVGERALGLPPEPRPDRDVPFRLTQQAGGHEPPQ